MSRKTGGGHDSSYDDTILADDNLIFPCLAFKGAWGHHIDWGYLNW